MGSSARPAPLVLANVVGLTSRLLPLAPRLAACAARGWTRPLRETVPAVTSTAQATILTGGTPRQHGIVANGWLFRDTMEVRFWQQSNRLLERETIYAAAKRLRPEFRCTKLFWWFNQGADVAASVTPKPWYGADGNKVFGVAGTPPAWADDLPRRLGAFPFPAFWGPMAGLASTQWIARAAALAVREQVADLTLVYLPHLDYDPQRHGPAGCDMNRQMADLDAACGPLLDAVEAAGARLWLVSEYGHCDVRRFARLNLLLRRAGLLAVRPGPFGETVDTFGSRAFAVCDHQIAHVYCADERARDAAAATLAAEPCVARLLAGAERAEFGLDHPRSGELVALAQPDAWFAYRFWEEDRHEPDFARTVDIHRKIGFDPCEMFFDPGLRLPKLRAARRLLQKKLGFRTRFDVAALDESLVRGSHGLPAADALDRPVLCGDGPAPPPDLALTDVYGLLGAALGMAG